MRFVLNWVIFRHAFLNHYTGRVCLPEREVSTSSQHVQCKVGLKNLHGFWAKSKMETLIPPANNGHLPTNDNTSLEKPKNEGQSFKIAVQNAVRLQLHWQFWKKCLKGRGGLVRILQYIV